MLQTTIKTLYIVFSVTCIQFNQQCTFTTQCNSFLAVDSDEKFTPHLHSSLYIRHGSHVTSGTPPTGITWPHDAYRCQLKWRRHAPDTQQCSAVADSGSDEIQGSSPDSVQHGCGNKKGMIMLLPNVCMLFAAHIVSHRFTADDNSLGKSRTVSHAPDCTQQLAH